MEKGWDARDLILGLLAERLDRGEPGTQEWLAEETGIKRVTINAYLTKTKERRRMLGMKNARRIAAALEVSPVEVGAPEPAADDERGQSMLRRLQELEAEVGWLRRQVTAAAAVLSLELEPREGPRPAQSGDALP